MHPHMLRHTFITTMLDAEVDLRDVQIAEETLTRLGGSERTAPRTVTGVGRRLLAFMIANARLSAMASASVRRP